MQRRPLPADNLVLLATGQAKEGKPDYAMLTIQIAGQRGWRDPIAQEAVLRLALAARDKPEAARRSVALFLQRQTPDALLEELDIWSRDLMVQYSAKNGRMHYGPDFTRERPHESGSPSSNTR